MTEGERTRGCCLHQGVDVHKMIQVSLLFSARLYLYYFRTYSVYLSFRLFAPAGQKSTSLLRGRQGGYRRKATDSTWDEKHHSRIDGNAITGHRYNPSVKTCGFASSPSIRSEAPSFIVARAAKPLVFGTKHQTQNVVRQSRTNILPKIHRGAEVRAQYPHSKAKKYSLPPALPEGGYIFIYSCAKSFLNLSSFSASSI